MITDPIYAGIGSYEAIVEEKQWLDANVRMIEEEGAQAVIKSVLDQFKEVFSGLPVPDAEPYIQQAKRDPRAALRRLLTDLRNIAEEKRV